MSAPDEGHEHISTVTGSACTQGSDGKLGQEHISTLVGSACTQGQEHSSTTSGSGGAGHTQGFSCTTSGSPAWSQQDSLATQGLEQVKFLIKASSIRSYIILINSNLLHYY